MAAKYFLYTTEYNNTLMERSDNSFAPLPPNTGEIFIDYFIPEIQPLYLYRESGSTIVQNDDETINQYLASTAPPPEPDDNVFQYQFTGYTATTETEIEGIKTNYLPLTGGTINGALNFSDENDGIYGQLIEGQNGAMKIAGDVGINFTAPALIIPNASGFSGSYLTIGQNGLITFTGIPTGGTAFWQETNTSTVLCDSGDETDLGVNITINENVDNGNVEWNLTADNLTNQTAIIELRIYKGITLVFTEDYSLPKNDISFLYGSLPFSAEQLSGSNYDLKLYTDRDVTASDILFRINKASDGNPVWGSIVGNINDQSDLKLALDNKLNLAGGTITGDLRINESLYITGTSATTTQLQDAVLLGALTPDGKIVATNTPALNVSEEVNDINSNTTISNLSGIYYVDTTSGDITIQIPDASNSNDVSKLSVLKKAGTNNVIITTTGGTQNIGNQTTQIISQIDKGISVVSDADNDKWIVIQDSRYVEGFTEGELQYWNNTLKVWQPTTNDITWDNTNLKFTVGGNSTPQTFQVDGTDDIVYINTSGLTGLSTADDLGLYAGGRGAFGNAVTIDRLRANAPSNQPRSFSLIDTNAVMRVWRYVADGNDPAVEFIWGTGATPSTIGNAWWDMFLDGAASPDDSFAIRRRTENNSDKLLTVSITGITTPVLLETEQKINLNQYINTNLTDGDFWWDGTGLYIRSGVTSINLIPPKGPLKSVQVRQSTQVNNIPQAWTDFSWDSTDVENDDTVIKHDDTNTDRVYVYEDGLYYISYQYQIDDESSTRVRLNDTTTILGSETTADANAVSLPMSKSFLVNLVAGDYVTMQTLGLALGQDIDFGATMIVVKYDGLKGDKGEDGQGSSIIIQNENVNVPNTPHGTVNFDDNFTVVDNGSGKATVSYVPTGSATDGKIQLIDSVGGQDLASVTPIALTWAQQDFYDNTTFTHSISGSSITVLKTGLYELSFSVNGGVGSTNRTVPGVQFRKNSVAIPPTLTADYGRNASNNDTNNTLTPYLISLTANDVLDVVGYRLGDATTNTTLAGASFMRITYLG